MQIARELLQLAGIHDAAVVMATAANKALLRDAGLLAPEIQAATANDLVIVVSSDTEESALQALQAAEKHLSRRTASTGTGQVHQPRTLRSAARTHPESNLALISVAGQYATAEAWEALRCGLHVMLFSDNVPIQDELALKTYASEHDLLMMGAGCGTAILNGVALGFANVVPRGPVGIVAAAGTGLQEVSTQLARQGIGISQGIGTGGRDLHEIIGGITMLQGLRWLQNDPRTHVVLLVSKPPAPSVAARVLEQVRTGEKTTVACFLGGDPAPITTAGAIPARTLQEAALLAAAEVEGYEGASADEVIEREIADLEQEANRLKARLKPEQKYLRGLFSGGTLTSEALVIWEETLGPVYSNVAQDSQFKLDVTGQCRGHCAIDLGEEEFTVGRPHPMIDYDLRLRRLMQEAADPEVAAIVLDVVLGYGAHPDPAAELAPAIYRARSQAAAGTGRELVVIASVTGTDADPQGLTRQSDALERAGAIVASCNAAAARLAGFVVT
jgi:FdrA protein